MRSAVDVQQQQGESTRATLDPPQPDQQVVPPETQRTQQVVPPETQRTQQVVPPETQMTQPGGEQLPRSSAVSAGKSADGASVEK